MFFSLSLSLSLSLISFLFSLISSILAPIMDLCSYHHLTSRSITWYKQHVNWGNERFETICLDNDTRTASGI